jgi:hypothetical protein
MKDTPSAIGARDEDEKRLSGAEDLIMQDRTGNGKFGHGCSKIGRLINRRVCQVILQFAADCINICIKNATVS